MMMRFATPTKIILPDDSQQVKSFLTFNDRSVGFQISRAQQNFRWRQGDPEAFKAHIDKLKAEQNKCLLFYDADGTPWTYAGLWSDLSKRFGWEIEPRPPLSADGIIPWKKIPHKMRYYQAEAVEALSANIHAAIELPTGSGKSLIIKNLLKGNPVKSLIITPFTNITTQLRKDLEESFGTKYVGQYGAGRKKSDKLFTVANAQSITRIEKGSAEWDELSKCEMIIFDESHMVPAESFKSICLDGVAADCPYRYFLSATQTRTDGSEMLLKGITGPVVYRKTFKELAAEGYLKKVTARMFKVPVASPPVSDPKKETRNNLYNNPNVAKMAAMIAEKAWRVAGRQTVILIEEYSQFLMLKNYMNVPYEFAHGAINKDAKQALPEKYWKCDIDQIVSGFNDGEFPVLIGTTAISTGVDIKPTGCIIYLQGGTSEIKVKQGVGRGTRPVGPKDLWVCDIMVDGSPVLERHAKARISIYEELTDDDIPIIG